MTPYRLYRCRLDGVVEITPAQALVVIQHGRESGQVRWWLQFACPGCGALGDLKEATRGQQLKWRNAGAADVVLEYPAEMAEDIRVSDLPAINAYEVVTWAEAMADGWLEDALAREVAKREGGQR